MWDFMEVVIVLLVIVAIVGFAIQNYQKLAPMSSQERAEYERQRFNQRMAFAHGPLNPALVCPHCQSKGCVRVKAVTQKMGVSGGKATAAILTAGISMLATGLSRKQNFTQAHCQNCNSGWMF
jgi:hypothetical protein